MEDSTNVAADLYLVDAYVNASSSWEDFRRHQEPEYLNQASKTLCEAHERLRNDDSFWARLHDLPRELQKHRNEVDRILNDFDSLLLIEENLLTSLTAYDSQTVARIISEMNLAISLVRGWPDARAIENLRGRFIQIQEAACKAHESLSAAVSSGLGPFEDYRKKRLQLLFWTRVVHKALWFAAGGALVVLSGHGAVAITGTPPPVVWSSTLAGAKLMHDQVSGIADVWTAPPAEGRGEPGEGSKRKGFLGRLRQEGS